MIYFGYLFAFIAIIFGFLFIVEGDMWMELVALIALLGAIACFVVIPVFIEIF